MVLKAALVITVALVLQAGVLAELRIAGAVGNLLLVVVVAAGITGGADRGATYGLAAGLALDLLVDSPFGMSALVFVIVGWLVGTASSFVRQPVWWLPVIAFLSGPLAAALSTAVGHAIGVPYPVGEIMRIGLVEGVIAAALVVPIAGVVHWVHGRDERDPLRVALR